MATFLKRLMEGNKTAYVLLSLSFMCPIVWGKTQTGLHVIPSLSLLNLILLCDVLIHDVEVSE